MATRKSSKPKSAKRPTVKDVARVAGVSLATVDRVLNRRKGVRQATIDKVEKAVAELGFARDVGASLLARSKSVRIDFIIPSGANPFMQSLRAAIEKMAADNGAQRVALNIIDVPALDAEALAAAIDAADPETTGCLVVVASDEDQVRRAIARAKTRHLPVLTLVSDIPESHRAAFIGIDNVAAGRTAGALMGRFLRPGDQVGLIVGSLDLRDHRERFIGFSDAMLEHFPDIQLIGPAEGYDDPRETAKRFGEFLTDQRRLAGIYSIGAGNEGLFDAMRGNIGPMRLRVIVHELTAASKKALRDGFCDVVLDQNPVLEAQQAIELAVRAALTPGAVLTGPAVGIDLYLRDNLPAE